MKNKKIRLAMSLIALTTLLSSCTLMEPPEDLINNEISLNNPAVVETFEPVIPTIEEELVIEETLPTVEELSTMPEQTQAQETQTQQGVEYTAPAVQSSDYMVVYATSDVNFRSSNSTSAMKIGNLNVGDAAYRILSCDNNWDLVRYNGQIGFVCRDYLQYTDEYVDSEYEHMPKNDIVLTNTDLNFRTAPTKEGKKIDTFDEGTELQVLAEVDNGWLLVRHNGVIGYVSGEYTTSLLDKVNYYFPEAGLEELVVQKVIYSTSNGLNLREGEGTNTDVKDELTKYETARVLKETDEWYLVMTNDYEFGYLFKEYTKPMNGIFVDIDKSEQRMTLYNGNEVMVQTPVTTGKDSSPSDTGLFDVDGKQRDRYLTGPGYKAFVNYWIPYNGGEGIHDASWRSDSEFGSERYHNHGSHGCINTPYEAVEQIYDNVKTGTKVLVHK